MRTQIEPLQKRMHMNARITSSHLSLMETRRRARDTQMICMNLFLEKTDLKCLHSHEHSYSC